MHRKEASSVKILFATPLNLSNLAETSFPHLGIGYLASSLKLQYPNVEFKAVQSQPQYKDALTSWSPDIVCISAVSQYWNQAKQWALIAKQAQKPVIVGGIHISSLPGTLTQDMDVAVLGEGEYAFTQLISTYIESGKLQPEKVKSVIYHDNGSLIKSVEYPIFVNLDSLQFPDRTFQGICEHTSMFTSRGCPYRCSFCASTRYFSGKPRFFSADYVAEECHLLQLGYHVKRISFLDDLFIADKKRLEAIYELLGKRNLIGKLKFICNVRSNLVTDDLCRLLASMGVDTVGMGLESACPNTLAYLKGQGNITVEDHVKALELLAKYHITAHASFIIGSPHESREDILQTLHFIKDQQKRKQLSDFEVYVLMPFPATPVWDYATQRKLVSSDMNWDRLQYTIADFGPESIVLSEYLSYEELADLYQQFIRLRKIPRAKGMIIQGLKHPSKAIRYLAQRI
jgi:radical SAM superfamily enzyme YgiQ (UPF0313 family)